MLFSDLAQIVEGQPFLYQNQEVYRFFTDTRNLTGKCGEVFIAINANRDGHQFIVDAINRGTQNFIVEEPIEQYAINQLIVPNSLLAFQEIAKNHREKYQIPIIGITGSNGKTIVKEWLWVLLSQKFFALKSPKSYNSQIGVPHSVLSLRKGHEVAIFEAGISQLGEMQNLEQIIQPNIGIFTNLGEAHDEGFSTKQEKLKEKLLLFKNCKKLICKSEYAEQIKNELPHLELITWSFEDNNAHQFIRFENNNLVIGNEEFTISLTSKTDLENVVNAIITAKEMGMSLEEIQNGLHQIKPISMRLEFKKGINGCYLLDDTYNNDLEGLRVALDYLSTHHQNTKRTIILSDIYQTGLDNDKLYHEVASLLSDKKIDRLIGIGEEITIHEDLFLLEKSFFSSTKQFIHQLPDFQDEMIVVKGARNFQLERVVQILEDKKHGTLLEVSFDALRHNLSQYRNLLTAPTKLMAMVKANAYGMGILEVANLLQNQHVDYLGVAYVDEAILLRKNGIHLTIMIMNPYIESFAEFERYELEAEIFSIHHFQRMLKDTIVPPPVHLKINTGMHRLGFSSEEIPELIQLLKENPRVKVASIFTHFSSSDNLKEDEYTRQQAKLFEEIYQQISSVLGYFPIKHACNSSAMVRHTKYHFDMVRLGIGLYGFDPTGNMQLRTTSTLKATISQIRFMKKGETVGYSRKGILQKDSQIAVLSIGYEDGFLRIFGNGNGKVLINGVLCPTVGNICMDMTMVDVTGVEAKVNDEAIIFGESPTIQDLAQVSQTIPYEILTNISSRVKRVFVEG